MLAAKGRRMLFDGPMTADQPFATTNYDADVSPALTAFMRTGLAAGSNARQRAGGGRAVRGQAQGGGVSGVRRPGNRRPRWGGAHAQRRRAVSVSAQQRLRVADRRYLA